MAFSLYDATVANYLQALGAIEAFLDKGLAHFRENGIDPETIVEARLAPDMRPFRFQIVSAAHYSRVALDAAQNGEARPPNAPDDLNYAALQKMIIDARAALAKLSVEAVNACEGRDVTFIVGDRKLPFTAEAFLMTLALPNFYFHTTTAYDILRWKGVPIGKRDFIGQARMKA